MWAAIVAIVGLLMALLAHDPVIKIIGWCMFTMGGTVILGGVGSSWSWPKRAP